MIEKKLLKFKAEGREFSKFLISQEQFIQTLRAYLENKSTYYCFIISFNDNLSLKRLLALSESDCNFISRSPFQDLLLLLMKNNLLWYEWNKKFLNHEIQLEGEAVVVNIIYLDDHTGVKVQK